MPRTVEELLTDARARLVRLAPAQAAAAQAAGAVLVDIRGDDQIREPRLHSRRDPHPAQRARMARRS